VALDYALQVPTFLDVRALAVCQWRNFLAGHSVFVSGIDGVGQMLGF